MRFWRAILRILPEKLDCNYASSFHAAFYSCSFKLISCYGCLCFRFSWKPCVFRRSSQFSPADFWCSKAACLYCWNWCSLLDYPHGLQHLVVPPQEEEEWTHEYLCWYQKRCPIAYSVCWLLNACLLPIYFVIIPLFFSGSHKELSAYFSTAMECGSGARAESSSICITC